MSRTCPTSSPRSSDWGCTAARIAEQVVGNQRAAARPALAGLPSATEWQTYRYVRLPMAYRIGCRR